MMAASASETLPTNKAKTTGASERVASKMKVVVLDEVIELFRLVSQTQKEHLRRSVITIHMVVIFVR